LKILLSRPWDWDKLIEKKINDNHKTNICLKINAN
jgi:hypothetical protein